MNTNTYWNNNGKYQELADRLQRLIPVSGTVITPRANPALETFRKAANAYYDLYNNGLCNRSRSFSRLFRIRVGDHMDAKTRPLPSRFARTEPKMDDIVLAAAKEQGVI